MTPPPVIEYNEERHEYTIDGKVVPSATQLVKQFLQLDTSWLEAHPQNAERGTLIHNELAEFYRGEKGFSELSKEAFPLAQYLGRPNDSLNAEVLLWNATLGYAGTADIVQTDKENSKKILSVYDFKTGKSPKYKYCQVQLNLYRLALQDMGYDVEETHMEVIYPGGNFRVATMSWEEMNDLMKDDFKPDDELADKIDRLEAHLDMLRPMAEQYECEEKELKALMLEQFEKTGTGRYTGVGYTYTYTPASVRKSLDTKLVKEALGDRVEEFQKETPVAATIRMKQN